MMDSLAKCFSGFQESYENVLETKPIYRDNLDITLPLNEPNVSREPTKKSRCLERAKRIDKSLRFEEGEEEEEMVKPPAKKEGPKPRKVVRFQLENNKIFEPEKDVKRFDLDHELEIKGKPLEEKECLSIVEDKKEVVRVKIKMTKQEARKLLSKREKEAVLDFEHVLDQIKHVPVHQLQVSLVMVACNKQGDSFS